MEIKNYFLDNNVIIGFIYKLDSLNPPSENLVCSNNNLYYSFHVKVEIDKVSSRKNKEYDDFILLLLSKLRKHSENRFISRTSFHVFIDKSKPINRLSIREMHDVFDYIWDSFDFGENQEVREIKLKLIRFKYAFFKRHLKRKEYFIKIAGYIPIHRHKDVKVLDMIDAKKLNDTLHKEDEEILFDLHEYAKDHPELNLILVSWDKGFVRVVEELIEVLSINEYVCLD